MASKYDYPDPGSDPEYCDGLAADDWRDGGLSVCLWCGQEFIYDIPEERDYPYCSPLCATQASVDSQEDQ